jgi:GNAT superfamily N-acetyltransferase
MSGAVAAVELPPGIILREMTFDDIPAGLALCRASRWNQVARDWEQFLLLEPHGAAVAVRDRRVIGSVATLRFEKRFGWVSMVLVDPAERGQGVGRALLLQGLATLGDVVARLDATPAGDVLYRKLDFEEEYRLTRFQREPALMAASSPGEPVHPVDTDDWPSLLSLDAQVFGADRSDMLKWLAEGAPEYGWVCRSSGTVEGFLFGRHGHDFEHLGPVVARDVDVAQRLVGECLARYPARRFILDAPDQHASWQAWLQESGFTIQRPFVRMYRGQHRQPGSPAHLHATIGPEFG